MNIMNLFKKKLYKPSYQAKSYNANQILDFHWDWIAENNSHVVIEEFDFIEEKWKMELIRVFFNEISNRKKGEDKIKIILSKDSANGLIENLSNLIFKDKKRSKSQIIEQNLKLVNI